MLLSHALSLLTSHHEIAHLAHLSQYAVRATTVSAAQELRILDPLQTLLLTLTSRVHLLSQPHGKAFQRYLSPSMPFLFRPRVRSPKYVLRPCQACGHVMLPCVACSVRHGSCSDQPLWQTIARMHACMHAGSMTNTLAVLAPQQWPTARRSTASGALAALQSCRSLHSGKQAPRSTLPAPTLDHTPALRSLREATGTYPFPSRNYKEIPSPIYGASAGISPPLGNSIYA